MEERIQKEDIEKLLKEIKLRIGSEDDMLGVIEKHPVPVLLAAFGAGVLLSQIDDFLIEKVETGGSCPAIDEIMKVGLPLLIKKFIK
ncbi:MAG: hypothetical protein KO464_01245 [Candidatus Methanofastidiosum sp.]|nr:hypothetical protein [Methanofastidiosum sp.]